MTAIFTERKTCRSCGSDRFTPVMNLGNQYIVNFPDGDSADEGLRSPLEVVLCGNSECSLVQLKHTVNPDLLYRQFWYKSGISQTMRDALLNVTQSAKKMAGLKAGDFVVDIGANDGTLLRSYDVPGLTTVGFEPAVNLVQEASAGVSFIVNDYFNAKGFEEKFPGKKAKVVTSIAMFYDLENPNTFVEDIKNVLDKDGIWINQMNYLKTMLEKNAFDNISHEHLEYYSLSSLEYLLAKHDMEVVDVEQNDLNGGSFRAYIANKGAKPVQESVRALKNTEKELKTIKPYHDFAARIDAIKNKTRSFIEAEFKKGKKVYVYGASTRGNTLLQHFELDHQMLIAAAERNPVKWGKKTVGTNIPIISEEEARNAKPDYFIVLPWAFIKEFVGREKDFLGHGGSFIVPLPDFKVISTETL